MLRSKILSPDQIQTEAKRLREQGVTLVTTNGCFDVLHVGHLRYLQAAKETGDQLIILLNSDRSVQALKGPSRPIVPEAERAEMLAGLACVDYVVVFDEDTPVELLQRIQPHIHVKGGDYNCDTLPEASVLQSLGAKMEFIPLVQGRSTTNLIQRILESYQAADHATT